MNLINPRATDEAISLSPRRPRNQINFGKLTGDDFCDERQNVLESDVARLEIAVNQIITAQTVIRALADRVAIDSAKDSLSELADLLTDALGDTVSPVLSAMDEELGRRS